MVWHRPNSSAGRITSPFGERVPPYPGASSYHLGVDLRAGVYGVDGSIYAASAGVVSSRYVTPMGAQVVIIDHGGGITTRYVHMPADGIYVHRGDRVTGGQRIAIAGMTGAATVHLHFETRVNGTAMDPVPFLQARGVDLTAVTVSNPIGGGGSVTVPTLPGAPTPLTPEDDMTPEQIAQLLLDVERARRNSEQALKEQRVTALADMFRTLLGVEPTAAQIDEWYGHLTTADDRFFGDLDGVREYLAGRNPDRHLLAVTAALTAAVAAEGVDEEALAGRLAAALGPSLARTLGEALVRGAQG